MTTLRPASTADTDADRRQALAAPVHDPLWMLARHAQTRGFVADDAGSPVRVRYAYATGPLAIDGTAVTGPLEPVVEAEDRPAPAQLDTSTSALLAAELVRQLREAGLGQARVATLRTALAGRYPLHPVTPGAEAVVVAAGRLPDAARLATALLEVLGCAIGVPGSPAAPGPDGTHRPGGDRTGSATTSLSPPRCRPGR